MISINSYGKIHIHGRDPVRVILNKIHKSSAGNFEILPIKFHCHHFNGPDYFKVAKLDIRPSSYLYVIDRCGLKQGFISYLKVFVANNRSDAYYARRNLLECTSGDIYVYKYNQKKGVWRLRGAEIVKSNYCVLFPRPPKKKK